MKKSLIERFHLAISYSNHPHGCWEWIKSISSVGYGAIGFKGKVLKAHRMAYEIYYGQIPSEKWVLHKCDNRKCVNPDHLFLGKAKDNTVDMMQKNRGIMCKGEKFKYAIDTKGEKHGNSKLTEDEVKEIKLLHKLGISYRKLSPLYNVNFNTIGDICRGKIWRHIQL